MMLMNIIALDGMAPSGVHIGTPGRHSEAATAGMTIIETLAGNLKAADVLHREISYIKGLPDGLRPAVRQWPGS
jgi:hypothetical protein